MRPGRRACADRVAALTGRALSRLGFDPARGRFALRTALAACLGLMLAWLLGLEHPQWSAMTVWAASQPVRGLLLEKSLFRAAGTVAGVTVGVLLVLTSGGSPLVLVTGLALWIGLCVGIGNVLRGFVSYGTILAGYSASMVALLETANPGHIFALGLDRLLTVLVGVAVASLIGLLFTPKEAEDEVVGAVRRLSARVLRAMAARLRDGSVAEEEQGAILSEMAAIDEALDRHGAGSLRSRRSARTIRTVLAMQAPALLRLGSSGPAAPEGAAGDALLRAAAALEASGPAGEILAELERAEALSTGHPALREDLARLHAAMRDQLLAGAERPERPGVLHPLILHRDWVGARQAAIRAAGTMLLVGAAWLLSGWNGGAYVLLGTSVMISLFSTADDPAVVMRAILVGQVFGAAAALACRWLVWPFAGSELQLVLMMMPFIMLGVPAVAHRRTLAGGYDFSMVMLLLLQPAYPLAGSFGASLATATAVVAAPAIALFAYRHAFPTDARQRMNTLIAMMVHELQDMAADPDAPAHAGIWRARLHHRLLRLARRMEKAGEQRLSAVSGSLAVLQLGNVILRMHELLREPALEPGTRRAIEAALGRMRAIGRAPETTRRALALLARRLSRETSPEADAIGDAAEALAANLDFFGHASGGHRPGTSAGR